MVEVLKQARQAVQRAIEVAVTETMAKAIENAKTAIAIEVLSECEDVFDAATLQETILEVCRSFDFSSHI